MKRFLFILVVVIITFLETNSQPISRNVAYQTAIDYMEIVQDRSYSKKVVQTALKKIKTREEWNRKQLVYTINLPDSGWVVVAGDSRVTPILAFSPTGTFPTEEVMPPAMKALMENYAEEIKFVQDSCKKIKSISIKKYFDNLKKESSYSSSSYTSGTYLLNTSYGNVEWGQHGNNETMIASHPYNKCCPSFSTGCSHAVVGCVAVAMAQIMWYWQWPHYVWIPKEIDAEGQTHGGVELRFYDWEKMPAKLVNNTPIEEVTMVAGLLRDCGYASRMKYGCKESITYPTNAQVAFQNTFSYNAGFEQRRSETENWEEKLRQEIDEGRPILYGGFTNDKSVGHVFVIDGYAKEDRNKFHVNWGDTRTTDDYFFHLGKLLRQVPYEDLENYNMRQSAIMGIEPNCILSNSFVKVEGETESFFAKDGNIIEAKNCTLSNGAVVKFIAHEQVRLQGEFRAKPGSDFQAKIVPRRCKEVPAPQMAKSTILFLQSTDIESVSVIDDMPDGHEQKSDNEYFSLETDEVLIYPNPTIDYIKVVADELQCVELLTLNLEWILRSTDNFISVSHLPKGIYIVKIMRKNKKPVFRKIIKDYGL